MIGADDICSSQDICSAELIKESKLRSSAAPVPDGCAVAADASEAKARATTLTAERLIIF